MRAALAQLRATPLIAVVLASGGLLSSPAQASPMVERIPSVLNGSPAHLPWVHTNSNAFVVGGGTRIVLRGFVTTPRTRGAGGLRYTKADYARLRSLGANYQSIRLTVGALGYNNGGIPAPGYLRELQDMVRLAAEEGIYSEFKLTTYATPGFDRTAFWLDSSGQQAAYIQAYTNVWRLFVNNPDVVGYDLLNEPTMGRLKLTAAQFESTYLNPFYGAALAALRTVDTRHIAFYQPVIDPRRGPLPYQAPLRGSGIAYAPHFYPPTPNFEIRYYLPVLQRLMADAKLAGVPMILGEYGTAWNLRSSPTAALERKLQTLEQAYYTLFLRYRLSYSRPWFADDLVATHTSAGKHVTWSLVASRRSLSGPMRPWIAVPFADASEKLLQSG